MPADSLPDVHKWLVGKGFKRLEEETRCFAYEGSLQCNKIIVPIRLEFNNLDFIDLPTISLIEPRPKPLQKPLPHIDRNNTLCYLDKESYYLDRYSPTVAVASIIEQARNVLTDSLTGKNSNDVGYEFSAYWSPSEHAILLDSPDARNQLVFQQLKYTNINKEERNLLLIGTHDSISKYSAWRGGHLSTSRAGNICWVLLGRPPLLPSDGSWPPSNPHELYTWLNAIDTNAARRLYNLLGTKTCSRYPILLLFAWETSLFGVVISLPSKLHSSSQDPSRFRKLLLSDHGHYGTRFIRIHIDDSRTKYLISRNLAGANLEGKRITLIGCGTIGGHLARLLVQAGAGSQKGELLLYDNQDLTTGNLGRHYLDGRYLYENKAEGCAHKLKLEFPKSNIKAISRNFNHIKGTRSSLIIDSTGYEAWSTILNDQHLQQTSSSSTPPPVLYVWVDGSGYCGRTLHVDGTGGCYRCLRNKDGMDRYPPLSDIDDITPIRYQCGESYIPFPASASLQAAAMGLEAALDWANGNPSPRFRTRAFNSAARHHKNKNIEHTNGCPACQI